MYGSFSSMARDHANSTEASARAADRARAARQERRAANHERRAANYQRRAEQALATQIGYVARHAALPAGVARARAITPHAIS